ncbi:MAG TPA: hypothetical protein VMV05_03235 [bacterium]|nr:hypothetical protein [bacterium]
MGSEVDTGRWSIHRGKGRRILKTPSSNVKLIAPLLAGWKYPEK